MAFAGLRSDEDIAAITAYLSTFGEYGPMRPLLARADLAGIFRWVAPAAGGARAASLSAMPRAGRAGLQRLQGGCHQVGKGAEDRIGPHLNGIFGRRAAAHEGYAYSASMRAGGRRWADLDAGDARRLYRESARARLQDADELSRHEGRAGAGGPSGLSARPSRTIPPTSPRPRRRPSAPIIRSIPISSPFRATRTTANTSAANA